MRPQLALHLPVVLHLVNLLARRRRNALELIPRRQQLHQLRRVARTAAKRNMLDLPLAVEKVRERTGQRVESAAPSPAARGR